MLTRVAWQLCVDDAFLVSKPRTVWEFVRTRTLESVSPYTNTRFGAEFWVASWENSTSWTPRILAEFWGPPSLWFGGVVMCSYTRTRKATTPKPKRRLCAHGQCSLMYVVPMAVVHLRCFLDCRHHLWRCRRAPLRDSHRTRALAARSVSGWYCASWQHGWPGATSRAR